jgi:hypothetical protein
LARFISIGARETPPLLSVLYLLFFALAFVVLALKVMRRRLIK